MLKELCDQLVVNELNNHLTKILRFSNLKPSVSFLESGSSENPKIA